MTQDCFILGCGKMGSAMVNGWLAGPVAETHHFIIIDPYFKPESLSAPLAEGRVSHFATCEEAIANGYDRADKMLLSVKPQMMAEALAPIAKMDISACCFISIAAGLSLTKLAQMIGADTLPKLIRAMPNTPAAIGKGITGLIGNDATNDDDIEMAMALLSVCGQVVRLDDERQIDAVTALSGSGPAYVFLLAEVMARAGTSLGLSDALSAQLANATINGAGALLEASDEPASVLRQNVTSKGGTTAAALEVLMAEPGLAEMMAQAMAAAYQRAGELDS